MKTNAVYSGKEKVPAFIKIFIMGFMAMLISCSGESSSSENIPDQITPAVEAVQTRYGSLPLTQRLSGIVEAKNQIEIYSEINAVIVDVYVKNGDAVKKGDPLVRLRDREFQERVNQAVSGYQIAVAQYKQAEAGLNEIKSALRRIETLAAQGLTSTMELETMQTKAITAEANLALASARVDQAKATVDERNATLAQTIIRSPIKGSVGNREAEVGMLVSENSHLFTMGQLENVRIKVVLTDRMLSYIREGQRVEIVYEHSTAGIIHAELSQISPFLNPVTHSTEAEMDLENPDGILKSGMFVTVDIFYGESEQATLVPLSALYENPESGITGVYITDAVFDNETAVSVKTETSVPLSEAVEFKFIPVDVIAKGRMEAGVGGIDPGKWVITLGQNLLDADKDKARVRPVKWTWVERLQLLQREDLMDGLVKRQPDVSNDTVSKKLKDRTVE